MSVCPVRLSAGEGFLRGGVWRRRHRPPVGGVRRERAAIHPTRPPTHPTTYSPTHPPVRLTNPPSPLPPCPQEVGRDRATGKVVVRVSPEFYRPTEVDHLLGNPRKAVEQLGFNPRKTSFKARGPGGREGGGVAGKAAEGTRWEGAGLLSALPPAGALTRRRKQPVVSAPCAGLRTLWVQGMRAAMGGRAVQRRIQLSMSASAECVCEYCVPLPISPLQELVYEMVTADLAEAKAKLAVQKEVAALTAKL